MCLSNLGFQRYFYAILKFSITILIATILNDISWTFTESIKSFWQVFWLNIIFVWNSFMYLLWQFQSNIQSYAEYRIFYGQVYCFETISMVLDYFIETNVKYSYRTIFQFVKQLLVYTSKKVLFELYESV